MTREPGTSAGRWAVLVLVLPVALWVLNEAQRSFRADWASAAVRQQVLQWVAGTAQPQSPAEWEAARVALQASLAITPDDPELHERLGDLQAVAGQRDWTDVALRHRDYAQALSSYQKAIALRPTEPQTWAMRAAAGQAAGEDPASVHKAWARALQLGPFEGHVQPILLQIVLVDWDGATPAMRAWAEALFDHGDEATRRDINALAARSGLHFSPDREP